MLYSFANQKGGVGKSTLVLLFANYLSSRGENVLVLDADRQASLDVQRSRDKSNFPDDNFSYEIIQYSLDKKPQEIYDQLIQLRDANTKDHIIVDLPGNLNENGIVPILALSNIVLTPFQYERKSLDSTAIFVQVLKRIIENYNSTTKLFFIPNKVKTHVGTKEEKEIFAQIEERLTQYGSVLPYIKELQTLTRVISTRSSKEQMLAVSECFDELIRQSWE